MYSVYNKCIYVTGEPCRIFLSAELQTVSMEFKDMGVYQARRVKRHCDSGCIMGNDAMFLELDPYWGLKVRFSA